MSLEKQKGLDMPFKLKEIKHALGALQSSKSAGEDGFPSEFYKEYKDILLYPLMELLYQAERINFDSDFNSSV